MHSFGNVSRLGPEAWPGAGAGAAQPHRIGSGPSEAVLLQACWAATAPRRPRVNGWQRFTVLQCGCVVGPDGLSRVARPDVEQWEAIAGVKPLVPPMDMQLEKLGFSGNRTWLDEEAANAIRRREQGSSSLSGVAGDGNAARPAWKLCKGDASIFDRNDKRKRSHRERDHEEGVKDSDAVLHAIGNAGPTSRAYLSDAVG